MSEIQLGQGAIAGIGHKIPAKDLSYLKYLMGLRAGEDAIVHTCINGPFSQGNAKVLQFCFPAFIPVL